jgi:hypothetical protein
LPGVGGRKRQNLASSRTAVVKPGTPVGVELAVVVGFLVVVVGFLVVVVAGLVVVVAGLVVVVADLVVVAALVVLVAFLEDVVVKGAL